MSRAKRFPFRPRRPSALLAALPLAAAALLGSPAARGQAGPIEDARRQAETIERLQQERLREAQERALPPATAPRGADPRELRPQVAVPDVGPGCHLIEQLRLEGASLLDEGTRAALVRDYAGRCLAAADLQSLLAVLTQAYVDRGYITTRAYLPEQDLGRGVLTVRVVEGTIEGYRLEEDGRGLGGLWLQGAFPRGPGEPLNLRDLEQGLEQINTLRSNTARLDLEPGTQPGQSMVVVHNRAERPVYLQLGYDNLGSPSTGRHNLSASFGMEGLMGLNELVVLTRNQTLPESGRDEATATALLFSLPLGYTTLAADASESNYTTGMTLPSGALAQASGTTSNVGMTLSRVVFRSQASRVAVSGRLATSNSRNYLSGQLLTLSSRKLATLHLGATAFTRIGTGVLNGGLAYVRGLDAFGALRDLPGTPRDFPHAQFGKFTLDLGYRRPLRAGPVPLQWSSQVSAQYSRQTLYGSQQLLVGSPATVRGSRANSLSGDHGVLWRNDLSWPWQAGPIVGSVYAGWDIGRVDNHAGDGGRTGSLSGTTLGVAGQYRAFNFEVFASRAMHLPSFFRHEGTLLGVRLSCTL